VWTLVRLAALLVLTLVAAVLAGAGEVVVAAVAGVAELAGWELATPDGGTGTTWEGSAVALAAGLAVGLVRPPARLVRQVVTLVHELGHTVVAAALGARPSGIVLRHDASGHATARWIGRPSPGRRFALAAVAFAGVPAATVATATGAQLLTLAGPRPVLWSLAAVGVVVASLARSAWSLLIAVAFGGLAVVALRDAAEPWAGAAVVGLLAAVVVRAVLDDLRALRRPLHPGDDARAVGRQVWLPPRVVQVLQVAASTAAGAWTLWLLTPELRTLA
jgi:hypothetical protein